MGNSRPQNRSFRLMSERSAMARFLLAVAIGLFATAHTGVAQPPEAPPGPSLELVLEDGFQWVEPDLLLVSFALRNTGTKPVVVAQLPGVNLDISCSTEDGGFTGRFGGVACVWDGAFLELGPGAWGRRS